MLSSCLATLWFCSSVVLWQVSASTALSYTSIPHNITQESGKTAIFLCGVSPATASARVDFSIHRRYGNHSMLCPGKPVSLPSKGLNGYCEVEGQELRAVWSVAYSNWRDTGSYVVCQPTGLSPAYAYLTVKENKSYFYALIGCIVGSLATILIIAGLAYLGMNHSERFRRCFKGRTTQDDLSTIIED